MPDTPPRDPGDHAEQFAHDWRDKLEEYCSIRMDELGMPSRMNGEPDHDGDGRWRAFNPYAMSSAFHSKPRLISR
jgi:hypothetical protein